jgi:SPP1 gp7 family putative phage head morphogenesis protein
MKAPWDVVRFDEAVLWFRARLPKLKDVDFRRLVNETHHTAQAFASKAQLDLTNQVWAGIDSALESGTTFADFKKRITEAVQTAWGGQGQPDASRLETIFRTNVQTAYGAGRVEQLQDPDVLESRPFWRYSAIHDSRTSVICRDCDGTVLPANHPWWSTHQPPMHHRCRCTIIAMRPAPAERRGITVDPTDIEASPGFGNVEKVREFRPSKADYPAELVRRWKGP